MRHHLVLIFLINNDRMNSYTRLTTWFLPIVCIITKVQTQR